MSSKIVIDLEKMAGTIEADAEVALAWLTKAGVTINTKAPAAIAALGVLLGGVDKALSDTSAAAGNPTSLLLNFGTDVSDLKALWPEVKTLVESLGIKF